MGKKVSKVRSRRIAAQKLDILISQNGGYSKAALASLGVSWPPPKGWKKALINGTEQPKRARKDKRSSSHRSYKQTKAKSDKFYASWEWKKARYEALQIHGRQCMCCGWTPSAGVSGHLCVDHIKPRSKHPSLALDVGNLQVLCNSCNMGKSNVHEDDFRAEWHGEEDDDTDPLTLQFRDMMRQ